MTIDKPPHITSKLPQVGTTIFSTMTALANQEQAINLAQGFPEYNTDPRLIDLVSRYMHEGHNQYAPLAGVAPLREVIVNHIQAQQQQNYDVEKEITITAGATQAIAAAISTVVRDGDEVIIFTPAYDCYAPMVELNGGIPVFVKLQYPGYQIDWEQVKKLLNHRTRLIIINTPHNPSTTVLSAHDMDRLEEITRGSNILILSDEVYEHITTEGNPHLSVCSRPGLAQRSFIIGSLGKSLHITGWKTGYCLAPEALMNEFRKVHQFMIFSINTPVQLALAEYLSSGQRPDITALYEEKRRVFLKSVENSRFVPLPAQGTFFQLLDYSAISQEGDMDFARRLTAEHKVAAIPLSVFYNDPTDHKVLRFCFAKHDDTLREAGKRLSAL